ncbi:MAG TPA: hypothetical protein VGM23_10515 [Armatimonadota bacterium]
MRALAGVVLAWGAWAWHTQPETMRLVGQVRLPRIPWGLPPGGYLCVGASGGVCLLLDQPAQPPNSPFTLTSIDWDGRARWQATLPPDVGHHFNVEFCGTDRYRIFPTLALSPDGRTLALAQRVGREWRITRWHDGRLFERVGLTGIPRGWYDLDRMRVTDSGRIWLLLNDFGFPCRLLAVDGTRVAQGAYQPSFPPRPHTGYEYAFSRDGSTLLCNDYGSVDYVSVRVQGEKVILARRYTSSIGWGSGLTWLDNTRALGVRNGALLGLGGLVHGPTGWITDLGDNGDDEAVLGKIQYRANNEDERRLYLPPPGHPWLPPANNSGREIDFMCCSEDGQVALMNEGPFYPSKRVRGLLRWLHLDPLVDHLSLAQLVIYTSPNQRRAVLPEPAVNDAGPWLSPDGHRVAVLREGEIRIYSWGKDTSRMKK